jgi:lipopolysaccharide/colanic/teichoic acid biosynthesis glycosyltransferase
MQAKKNDPRVTSLGRILRVTAMDALPQLLNIAFSDMSFVGPRALRPVEIDSGECKPKSIWEFKGAKERCQVKPGLTGIAQILAPRDASREEKFRYDIWYIKNRTFFLDIYIIFVSFLITFSGRWEKRERQLNSFLASLHSLVSSNLYEA